MKTARFVVPVNNAPEWRSGFDSPAVTNIRVQADPRTNCPVVTFDLHGTPDALAGWAWQTAFSPAIRTATSCASWTPVNGPDGSLDMVRLAVGLGLPANLRIMLDMPVPACRELLMLLTERNRRWRLAPTTGNAIELPLTIEDEDGLRRLLAGGAVGSTRARPRPVP